MSIGRIRVITWNWKLIFTSVAHASWQAREMYTEPLWRPWYSDSKWASWNPTACSGYNKQRKHHHFWLYFSVNVKMIFAVIEYQSVRQKRRSSLNFTDCCYISCALSCPKSPITVCSTACSGSQWRKRQSHALPFLWGGPSITGEYPWYWTNNKKIISMSWRLHAHRTGNHQRLWCSIDNLAALSQTKLS